jgi:hypothetical protein
MHRVPGRLTSGWACRAWPALPLILLLAGCNSRKEPVYQNKQGFRFTPPSGWVERARDDALPARTHKAADLPLPRLDVSGKSRERLLVEYQRLRAGYHAWLRVTCSDSASSLQEHLSARAPGPNWKREGEVENLEVRGLPCGRIAFLGRWNDQDYISETVAVRHGANVYILSASFPASDSTAREQVRQAIADAGWK